MNWNKQYSRLPQKEQMKLKKELCPDVNQRQKLALEIFNDLSSQRSAGYGIHNPISYVDLKAYVELRGISGHKAIYYIMNVVKQLDSYFLKLTAPKD